MIITGEVDGYFRFWLTVQTKGEVTGSPCFCGASSGGGDCDSGGVVVCVADVNGCCLVVIVVVCAGSSEVEDVALVPINYVVIYPGDYDCLGGVPVTGGEGEA